VTEVRELNPPTTPSLEMAHVLFLDIVGYSRLPMDRQQRVIHDLQEAVRGTSEFARAQAADQLIRLPTGDGMALVFFRDPEALNAVNCASGDPLAREQTRAPNKDAVLDVLGKAADTVRAKLGESLSSVRKYDVPLEQATTPSLDALRAYTLARKTQTEKGDAASISFYKRAIDFDTNFALAYSGLASAYNNLGQVYFAGENAQKAFDLREHVSEREKLRIAAFYHSYATGDSSRAIQAYELWAQNYPHDSLPRATLGSLYALLGQFEKSIAQTREAQQLDPDSVLIYSNLGSDYLALGKLDQAKQILDQAEQQKVDGTVLRLVRYQFAFLKGDAARKQLGPPTNREKSCSFLRSRTRKRTTAGYARRATFLDGPLRLRRAAI
jgi:tetratricopeptide (TPR) repeat protein